VFGFGFLCEFVSALYLMLDLPLGNIFHLLCIFSDFQWPNKLLLLIGRLLILLAVKTETEFDLELEIFLPSVSDLNHLLSSIKNDLRVKNIPEGIYKKANFVVGELANVEKNEAQEGAIITFLKIHQLKKTKKPFIEQLL
jgi:hypothetical protein